MPVQNAVALRNAIAPYPPPSPAVARTGQTSPRDPPDRSRARHSCQTKAIISGIVIARL